MKLCEGTKLGLFRNTISWRSFGSSNSVKTKRLYQRISPVGDPNVSVVPILDQWVREGKPVDQDDLQRIIKELRLYRRFNHALQISQWMSDKRYMRLSAKDIGTRLDLISRVHGLGEAENYFKNIPSSVKRFEVYSSLLSCYAREKSVEKAEATMQQICDLMVLQNPLCYNVLMNLYNQTGEYEKLNSLVSEMEANGIDPDLFTFSIRLGAYASINNIDGMDDIMEKVESNPKLELNWNFYAVAANGYIKVGLVDKAAEVLKKVEEELPTAKRKPFAYDFLLNSYAQIGNRDELYRIWNLYRKDKLFNKGYTKMITSLLTVDDVEGAEKVYKEWQCSGLVFNPSIVDLLIGAYCRKGFPGKARQLVEKEIAKGVHSQVDLWNSLAGRCLANNHNVGAVEALKKAIAVCPPGWKPGKETLLNCLEYLEAHGHMV